MPLHGAARIISPGFSYRESTFAQNVHHPAVSDILVAFEAFLIHQLVLGAWTRTEKQIYSDMNVGHGRPRFQNVKLISYGSTSCNFFKYLSLASLDCKLSKYLDKNNSGRLSRRFRCAYFRYHFLLKLSKQLEVVLQLATWCTTLEQTSRWRPLLTNTI